MPASYVDQVQKLDVRSMMAAAFKASPSDHYTVYRDGSGWYAAAENQAGQPAHQLVARIKLDRAPANGAPRPSRGQVLLTVVQPDGRSCAADDGSRVGEEGILVGLPDDLAQHVETQIALAQRR